jgi:hypothetical protein
MSEALLLYAQFLKEFPKHSVEEDPSIKLIVEEDDVLVLILQLPKFHPSYSAHSSFVYRRTVDWFCVQGVLTIEEPRDPTRGLNVRVSGSAWNFCILHPDYSCTKGWEYHHYV